VPTAAQWGRFLANVPVQIILIPVPDAASNKRVYRREPSPPTPQKNGHWPLNRPIPDAETRRHLDHARREIANSRPEIQRHIEIARREIDRSRPEIQRHLDHARREIANSRNEIERFLHGGSGL
jgi:hypothetical protein